MLLGYRNSLLLSKLMIKDRGSFNWVSYICIAMHTYIAVVIVYTSPIAFIYLQSFPFVCIMDLCVYRVSTIVIDILKRHLSFCRLVVLLQWRQDMDRRTIKLETKCRVVLMSLNPAVLTLQPVLKSDRDRPFSMF